jgi:hypothetical protein
MDWCQPRVVDVIINRRRRRIHTHPCMYPYPLTRLLVPPRRFINASPSSIRIMSVPKVIQDQIRQIIPPLNGKLHKGQSGTSTLDSPHALPFHTTQDVLEYSEVHLSAFLKRAAPIDVVSNPNCSYTGAPFFAAISAQRVVRAIQSGFALHRLADRNFRVWTSLM